MDLPFLVYCVLGICISPVFSAKYMEKKADWIKTCVIKDPVDEFTQCSTKSIQGLFRQANLGIEGLEMPPIEPFKIDHLQVLSGSGRVAIDASLTNTEVHGFSETQVIKNQVSPKDFSWVTHVFIPKMRLDGHYIMNGRILVLPLNGKGKILLEPSNMHIVFRTKVKLIEHDNHVFYDVRSTKVDYNMTKLNIHLDNLFNGVTVIEEATNRYLNENWQPVQSALKPLIESTVEKILLDIMKKIFDYIPAEYFVADIPSPSKLAAN